MWNPGDSVLLRYTQSKRVTMVIAATVVQDAPDLVTLYWAAGNPTKYAALNRAEAIEIYQSGQDYELVDTVWKQTDVICFIKPGDSHALWLLWREGHVDLVAWYVNLQDPLVRTRTGFDTTDLELDIVIAPDLSSWRWKDEEDLDRAIGRGLISPQRAASIRAEGLRVIATMHASGSPFGDDWQNWRPDKTWQTPTIPDGWQDL